MSKLPLRGSILWSKAREGATGGQRFKTFFSSLKLAKLTSDTSGASKFFERLLVREGGVRFNSISGTKNSVFPMLQSVRMSVLDNVSAVAKFFASQCNVIAAQKVRRGIQISNLYYKLYDEHSVQKVAKQWTKHLHKRLKSKPILLAVGALFSWEHERITEEDLKRIHNSLAEALPSENNNSGNSSGQGHEAKTGVVSASTLCERKTECPAATDWDQIVDKPLVKVWRRPVPGSHLYQYRVYGAYSDISAKAFYNVQVDLKYRRQWDKLVVKLNLIERDEESGSEVVQWITHYPFPMHSREYVYVRRQRAQPTEGSMLMTARAVDHPGVPESSGSVRVRQYESSMLIRGKGSVDQNGLEYVMEYFDDPRSSYPSVVYNWVASTGVPDFVDKIHDAAKRLQTESCSHRVEQGTEDICAVA